MTEYRVSESVLLTEIFAAFSKHHAGESSHSVSVSARTHHEWRFFGNLNDADLIDVVELLHESIAHMDTVQTILAPKGRSALYRRHSYSDDPHADASQPQH